MQPGEQWASGFRRIAVQRYWVLIGKGQKVLLVAGIIVLTFAASLAVFVGLIVALPASYFAEHRNLWVDQHPSTIVFDHFVVGLRLTGPFHGVFHAGTAALFDADAHTHACRSLTGEARFLTGEDGVDALGGPIGQGHDLGPAAQR